MRVARNTMTMRYNTVRVDLADPFGSKRRADRIRPVVQEGGRAWAQDFRSDRVNPCLLYTSRCV